MAVMSAGVRCCVCTAPGGICPWVPISEQDLLPSELPPDLLSVCCGHLLLCLCSCLHVLLACMSGCVSPKNENIIDFVVEFGWSKYSSP